MYIGEWASNEEDYQRRKAIYQLRNGSTGLETSAFNATRSFLSEIEPLMKEPIYVSDRSGLYMNWCIKDFVLCVNVNDYCFFLSVISQNQYIGLYRFEFEQIKQLVSFMQDNVNKLTHIY